MTLNDSSMIITLPLPNLSIYIVLFDMSTKKISFDKSVILDR